MLKQSFSDALKGIFIGLILSIFFSYLFSPELYLPLSPNSAVGRWMFLHHVHGSLVMLYCALVWGAIGVLFSFGSLLFQKDWSLLRATLSHYLLMLLGFIPLATLAGWFPARLGFYLSLVVEFTLVYVIIWLVSHHFYKKQVQEINQRDVYKRQTMNHLMLHKLGIKTFYGQSFLADICELDKEMLPYSRHYFKELIETGKISEIRPSNVWYEERTDFSPKALGTPRVSHANTGFDLLQGLSLIHI